MARQAGCPKRYYQHYLITVLIAAYLVFSSGVTSAAEMPVSSPYGWRIHPITGEYKFHAGVDLAYDYGAGVPALFDGMIIQAGDYTDGYGYQVLIYHQVTDTYTRYAHLSGFFVAPGQIVSQGELIGIVGSTGNSTGPHLHLEYIIPDGAGGYQYADPLILWQ